MSHQFTVLHISDLHERGPREKERARRYRVLGASWQKNLEELQQEGPIDLVCFTGDLADWGQAEEYERVSSQLDALLKQLGLGRERLFLVPGNHDIDRKILPDRTQKSPEQLAFENLRSNLHNAAPLHVARWLEGGKPPFGFEQAWLDLTMSRQNAYRDFLRTFGLAKLLPRKELHPRLGYRVSLQIPRLPFPVQVVGLDSSWLAGDDADSGRLRLTDGQVMKLCLDTEGGALPGFRLALVHHPLSDLADASQCRTLLADAVHLLLRGHMHESELTEWADSDRKLRSMAAGCLYEGERADQYPNSCSVIRVQCDAAGLPLRYDVRLRSFSVRSGHWFDDGGIYRNAPSGRLTIQLAAPPPVPPVVYESEPRDHGAASRALPVLRAEFLRELFAELLRTGDDLNSFALDFFPSVHRQFSAGMTREAREDLLFSVALPVALYEALRAMFGSKVPPPSADTAARATLPNPYRGLLVFGVQDAPLFFGRAKKTAELRQLFDAAVMTSSEAGPVSPRLVAVLGPSGSGKSSLAQAGLLADLLRKPPIGGSYLAAVLRPQGRPLRALARVLTKLKHASNEWPLSEIDAIVERLHKDPRALGDLVSDVLTQPEQRLLLVIDQLEELYTMAEPSDAATAERRAFVAAILTAASERRGRVDVVVTLRSDLLGEVGGDPALQQALTRTGRVLLVGSLDAEELAEAITGPAARAGRPLPADAVALLIREAEGQAGALPLLQFTMEKLWRAIDDAPSRPIADLLHELGGVGGSLAQEAEALYRGLHPQRPKLPTDPEPPPSAAQVRARRAFSRLLKTRDGQVLGRRRQALADLVGAGETLAELRAVLDRFVDSRLLVLDGEETEATVEIGHESLGRSWQRLARWLSEASVYLPVLLRISKDARRWHRQGQPDRLLLRSEELAELRRALPTLDASGNLGAREREFAQACLDGIKQRRKKRAAALAERRVARAVSVARHVVDRVMTRLEKVSGTAELRKELLADAMRELDELRTQTSETENTELLFLRSQGHRQRGDLAMTHDNLSVALREYEAARAIGEGLVQRLPGSSQAQRDLSISINKLGEVAVKMGQLGEAKVWFERSLKISEKLALADANDAQAQRDLSISINKLGEVAVKMGQLGEAKVWFERSLKISEKLALADANDAQAQRDLSISLEKLGEVAVQMGQLGEPKVWFERSLKIREKLALADANDAQAQRDLSVSFIKLGEVAVKMGQLGEAKVWFERSLKIREKLALADANNAQAQRDLSISINKLGEVAVKMGQLGEVKVWFERSLKIREKLALADAKDAQAQRDLSVSLNKLGEVAVQMGQLGEAKVWFERSLKIREKLALADAKDAQAQRDLSISLENLGEVAVQMGQLGEAKVWFERSLKISEKLALADANNAQAQRDLSISLNKLGDVAVQMGQLGEAKVWFERSLKISEKLALADANNAQAQRDLFVSLYKLGDVAVQMGQLGEAKVWFERSLKISEKLALADANDAQAQRDLSISLNKLGDVAVQMGQLGEAKVWFERSLKISEKLALADANDAQAQRDLSISLNKLGDVAVQMGQLGEAKVWFERDLKISEKLALADANNAQAQRDLFVSLYKLGDVAVKMGQLGEAKVWFERDLKISEKLALADANDAQAQRDLSISLEKLGDVAVKMGQLGEAKVWFERSLKISEKLALADANNAQAQRDLSISLEKLGEVAVKMGQLGEAKVWFERDLKISEKLALADANDAQAQRDLSISLNKLGDVAVQMGQLGEAKVWFERSLKIREKLALADANDAQAQRDLSISLNKLGDVAVQMGQLGEAKVWFERSLKIREKLALANANDAQAQRDLSISLNKLGDVAVQMGQLREAKVWFERSLKIREKLALADANDAQAQRDLIVSHYQMANLYHRLGPPSEARSEAQVAVTLLARLRPRLTKSDADSIEQALHALLR